MTWPPAGAARLPDVLDTFCCIMVAPGWRNQHARVPPRRCLFAMAGLGCSTPPDAAIEIRVLSGPADFVSGGDALVEVIGVDNVQITLNGHDVSSAFHVGPVPGSTHWARGRARRGSEHARSPGRRHGCASGGTSQLPESRAGFLRSPSGTVHLRN